MEFASVVDAVSCAAEVQRGMLDPEPGLPDERRIRWPIAARACLTTLRAANRMSVD